MNASAQHENQAARRGRTTRPGPSGPRWPGPRLPTAVRPRVASAVAVLVAAIASAAVAHAGEAGSGRFESAAAAAAVTVYDIPQADYSLVDTARMDGGVVTVDGLVGIATDWRDEWHERWLSDWTAPGDDAAGLDLAGFFHHHHRGPVIDDRPVPPAGPCDCPRWAVQIDALMLWQGALPSRPLYLNPGSVALNTNDLRTPLSVDPRYAVIFNRDQCRSVEVNYFGVWSFAGQAQALAQGQPMRMNDLGGLFYDDVLAAEATSHAHIKSLEVNMREIGWGGIRWLQGFRWVEWGQQLAMADVFSDAGGIGSETLQVNTLNNLYGWQWGGDATLWNRGGRLRFNGVAKAGIFGNAGARQTTVYESVDRGRSGAASARRDAPAFFGEVGINGSYAINEWLSWRAGYVFFWLGGVATPENQLSITEVGTTPPTASLNPWGSAMLHGVTTGLEARW
jgi:hypothetical protein